MAACSIAQPKVCIGAVDHDGAACTLCRRHQLRELWKARRITWADYKARLAALEPAGAVVN
jgi:hypothetical protein